MLWTLYHRQFCNIYRSYQSYHPNLPIIRKLLIIQNPAFKPNLSTTPNLHFIPNLPCKLIEHNKFTNHTFQIDRSYLPHQTYHSYQIYQSYQIYWSYQICHNLSPYPGVDCRFIWIQSRDSGGIFYICICYFFCKCFLMLSSRSTKS